MRKALCGILSIALISMLFGCAGSQKPIITDNVVSTSPNLLSTSTPVMPTLPNTQEHTLKNTQEPSTPSPSPTPAVGDLPEGIFDGGIDPGLRIGTCVISNEQYVYFYRDMAIYQLNRVNEDVERLLSTDLYIKNLFLDKNGSLYYFGCSKENENSMGQIYKYAGKKAVLIADNVYDITRVDQECIYYNYGCDSYSIRYGTKNHNDVITNSIADVLSIKPLIASIELGEITLTDLSKNKKYTLNDYREFSAFVTEDGSCLAYQRLGGSNEEVILLDFGNRKCYRINYPFYGAHFSCKQKLVVVSWATNYIYVIDKETNKVINQQVLVDDPNYKEINYMDSWFYEDGIIYICRSKVTELTFDEYPLKVKPTLYSYNISTGEYQIVCSLKPVLVDNGCISVEVSGGYYWFYSLVGLDQNYTFLGKIPIVS